MSSNRSISTPCSCCSSQTSPDPEPERKPRVAGNDPTGPGGGSVRSLRHHLKSGSAGKNFFWPESDVGRGTLFTLALTFAVVFATPSDREPSLTRLPKSDTKSQRDLR